MTIHEESRTIPIFIDEYLLIARLHAESLIRPTFLSDHWSKPILKDDELVFIITYDFLSRITNSPQSRQRITSDGRYRVAVQESEI